jgi:predicted nucleic acid-binding protein
MNLIFDTSILVDLERGYEATIKKLEELRKIYPAPAKIGFISYFEFLLGFKNKSVKNKEKARQFIEKFSVMQTTKNTAEALVTLKQKYELPLADLLIAAQVLENNAILVTKDKDFNMIKEMEKIVI